MWFAHTCAGGAFNGTPEAAFALLALAVRLGAEYVDVECCAPLPLREALLAKRGRSKVIASLHDWNRPTAQRLHDALKLCHSKGAAGTKVLSVRVVAKILFVLMLYRRRQGGAARYRAYRRLHHA